ncbi:MAG: hypothetical protein ACYTDT_03205 [Planctomycetota bacterium]|jgi:hypothetical protein
MVHIVQILAYTPKGDAPGKLHFKLDDKQFHARCDADPALADGLLVPNTEYPVTVGLEAIGTVGYEDSREALFEVTESAESGDRIKAIGRVWDAVDHQIVRLEANPSIALKLNLPQTASDYRGGSWLKAEGLLCVDLPPEEHD